METRREASLRERGAAGGLEIRLQDATLSFLIQIQEKKDPPADHNPKTSTRPAKSTQDTSKTHWHSSGPSTRRTDT